MGPRGRTAGAPAWPRCWASGSGVTPASSIPCGVALGIPQDRSLDTLRRWIDEALRARLPPGEDQGGPGWDAEPVRAARDALAGTGLPLTVDANGGYEWPEHESNLRALDDAGLLYIEQPLAPDELLGHARLAQALRTPVCLDETLHDARAARQLLELGGPRVWNVKVHRMGGLTEVCRVVRLAREGGVRLWAGTMPESGLGSQAALAAAALPGFVYPVGSRAQHALVRPGRGRHRAADGAGRHHGVPQRSIAHRLDEALFRRATRRLH